MSVSVVYAIIPARGGSKGVPQKNIRALAGYPLIAYSIAAARLSRHVSRVLVSTDSREIAEVARHFGAEVPFLRPPELARDDSPDREFMCHALDWLSANEGNIPELWVHLRPTTPLRDPAVIDEAIGNLRRRADASSLRSGHEAPESPFKWFTRDDTGFFRPLRVAGREDVPVDLNQPRQDFPVVFVPNGYVDVLRSSVIASSNTIHGDSILGYSSAVGYEIDTPEDFTFLEYLVTTQGHPLRDDLRRNFPAGR